MRADTALMVLGACVALILVSGFVVLAVTGRQTDSYVLFVSGPLVTTVVGAAVTRRVAAVEDVARTALAATSTMVPAQLLVDASLSAAGSAPATPPAPSPIPSPTAGARVG